MSQRVALPWRGVDRAGDALEVREAGRQDASRFLDHMTRIVAETDFMLQAPDDPLPTLVEQRMLFEQVARLPNCVCIIAVRPRRGLGPTEVVASLTCLGGRTLRTQHACHLGMGVTRADWGRGIGGLILDAGLTWARANPMLRRVSLQVFSDNAVARQLYVSRGFLEEGVLAREAALPGGWADLVGMGLDVGPFRKATAGRPA